MDGPTFLRLFCTGRLAGEASALAGRSDFARDLLAQAAAESGVQALRDSDRRRVVWAVIGDPLGWWRDQRNSATARDRTDLAQHMISLIVDRTGRAAARAAVNEIWPDLELEEEREAALLALDEASALSSTTLWEIGSGAAALADELRSRGSLRHDPTWRYVGNARFEAGPDADQDFLDRIAALLQPVAIESDLRDAGLKSRELGGLTKPLPPWTDLKALAELLDEAGIAPRNRTLRMLRRTPRPFPLAPMESSSPSLAFPLLRILHLQEIMNAPALAAARVHPERYLLPATYAYVLDTQPVSWAPEIRLLGTVDSGWKRQWSETMGETMSTLFMEAALDIDLTLLERVPETPSGRRPDFKAATRTGEHIVYEAKGSTGWQTHKRQRTAALEQLGKTGDPTLTRVDVAHAQGRAFACSTYAAVQGARRSSLLHVADPPFGFDDLFEEGWEERARRRHYAAVLQFAGQHGLAQALLDPNQQEPTGAEPQDFRLPPRGDNGQGFLGTWDDVESSALRLGIPRPARFSSWKVFRGVDRDTFRYLRHSDVPKGSENPRPAQPTVGLLPGDSRARGVYSILSNGAILALQTGD